MRMSTLEALTLAIQMLDELHDNPQGYQYFEHSVRMQMLKDAQTAARTADATAVRTLGFAPIPRVDDFMSPANDAAISAKVAEDMATVNQINQRVLNAKLPGIFGGF